VLFTSYISCELALPISPFFLLLLEEFGLQLQHLTPHSILQVAIFVHLCEMFVGVAPCTSLFRYFFMLVWFGNTREHIRCLLLSDEARPGHSLHPHLWRCEVGKLAHRLGDCQHRGLRPPHPAKHWASTRPQAMEDQAIPLARVPAHIGQDQGLGYGWPDINARGRRSPEAPDHAAAKEATPVLLVHQPERHQ
jgi:hypothetical protein